MPFKWAFLFILGLFKRTLQFLQQSYVKKILSRIHCWDLNPQPLERESPPITTRPISLIDNVIQFPCHISVKLCYLLLILIGVYQGGSLKQAFYDPPIKQL